MDHRDDLTAVRTTASRVLLSAIWLHLPLALLIAHLRSQDMLLPLGMMAATAVVATISWRSSPVGLSTRLLFAVALMTDVSVLTYQLAGHPWQLDIHMYFFAALACLVAYCDFRVIMAATIASRCTTSRSISFYLRRSIPAVPISAASSFMQSSC